MNHQIFGYDIACTFESFRASYYWRIDTREGRIPFFT
uniref:Uncharacterized protein n=1 Tax=Arundo donax TaxID=35708 RepID=A0A0A8Y992_ARUDO